MDMANGSRQKAQGEKRQFDFHYPCAVSLAPFASAQINPGFIQRLARLNPRIYDSRNQVFPLSFFFRG